MAGVGQTDKLMSEINVTPFVDVMLVLLIIFMVTAPMMVQGVDVALPETTSAPMETDEDNITITINKEQQIYVNDMRVDLGVLRDKVYGIHSNHPENRFFLRADKAVPYGLVVRVMADIKDAGVADLGVITQPLDEEDK